MNRDFKGIWIPKEIWLNDDLTLQEKVFLAEIDSLDNEKGCFASNEYFADFFGLSKSRCSKIITSLQNKKYLEIKYEFLEGTNHIEKRVIKLKRGYCEKERGYCEKERGYCENKKDITKYNNTVNNISSSSSSSEEIDNTTTTTTKKETNLIDYYKKNINPLASNLEIEKLISWLDDVDKDLIFQAIDEAILSNVRNFKYINAILFRSFGSGIRTKEEFLREKEIKSYDKRKSSEFTKNTGEQCTTKISSSKITRV